MYKQNLHVHSSYSDGKNKPEELVKQAIKSGFDSIGFSEHSYMEYSPKYGMRTENREKYFQEIEKLRASYKDKIKIFCGIEYDMYSGIDISSYDYAIGSVHYLLLNGKYVGMDRTKDAVKKIIDEHFYGDGLKYAKKYYEEMKHLPEYGKFDIIGHFDLLAKHCENTDFFDVNSKEYLDYAFDAINELKGKIPLFEVNTGAIARGYRTTPYPAVPIVKELNNTGFGAVITSDCHDAEHFDCYYSEAKELLATCGFKYIHILTENGFIPVKL